MSILLKKIFNLIKSKSGYTLTELAITTTIIALLSVGALTMIQSRNNNSNIITTEQRIKEINSAIENFVKIHNYIPCPALPQLEESDSNFGKSDGIYNTTTNKCSNIGIVNETGAIPTRTLNIADEMAYDGWGRKFVYRTASNSGTKEDFNFPEFRGNIDIVDIEGISKTNLYNLPPKNEGAIYVIISYGENGKDYAYRKNFDYVTNSSEVPIQASGIEATNTDHSRNVYIQNKKNDNFDDIVFFAMQEKVIPKKNKQAPFLINTETCSYAKRLRTDGRSALNSYASAFSDDHADQIYKSAVLMDELCTNNKPHYIKPIDISGLQLWLDSTDSETLFTNEDCQNGRVPTNSASIACWKDKSEKGNNAIERVNQPTYLTDGIYKKPAVNFDGVNDSLTIESGINIPIDHPRTVIAVLIPNSGIDHSTLMGTLNTNKFDFGKYNSNNRIRGVGKNNSGTYDDLYSNSGSIEYNEPHIIIISGKTGLANVWNDGLQIVNVEAEDKKYVSWAMDEDLAIGDSRGNQFLIGKIGEIIIYDKILSEEERVLIESSLANKWKIDIYNQNRDICGQGMEFRKTIQDPVGACHCPDGEEFVSVITPVSPCYINLKSFGSCMEIGHKPEYEIPPTESGLQLWLDANDCTSIEFTDGAVSSWRDKSGNENDVIASAASKRPKYIGNTQNGKAVVRFNEGASDTITVDDRLVSSKPFFTNLNNSIFMVIQTNKITNKNEYLGTGNYTPNNGNLILQNSEAGLINYVIYTDQTILVGEYDTPSNFFILQGENNGNESFVRLNGKLIDSQNIIGTNTSANKYIYIGGQNDTSYDKALVGDIAEVLIYDRQLTQQENTDIYKYLSEKWDIRNSYAPEGTESKNLVLWLDASDESSLTLEAYNTVSEWNDKSPEENHASQTTNNNMPVYNNDGDYPYLEFDGTNDVLTIADDDSLDITEDMTIFVVTEMNSLGLQAHIISKGCGYELQTLTTNEYRFSKNCDTTFNTDSKNFSGVLNRRELYTSIKKGTLTKIFYNSYNANTNIVDSDDDFPVNSDSVTIGGGADGYFNGKIYEILIYGSALSDEDRQKVEFYLIEKYGLNRYVP